MNVLFGSPDLRIAEKVEELRNEHASLKRSHESLKSNHNVLNLLYESVDKNNKMLETTCEQLNENHKQLWDIVFNMNNSYEKLKKDYCLLKAKFDSGVCGNIEAVDVSDSVEDEAFRLVKEELEADLCRLTTDVKDIAEEYKEKTE